jgi:hypothetical protein
MSDHRKTGSGLLALIGVAVLLLPVLYVASLGPAVYLHERGVLSNETGETIYAPLMLLADRSESFRTTMERYAEWWSALAHE